MIAILCGKTASGKDTLMRELVSGGEFEPIISLTSRPMRDGEKEGREYYFVSREEFERRIKDNEMLEYRSYETEVDGKPEVWYYGLPKQNLDMSKNYVVILDLEGAEAVQKNIGKENTFTVMMQSPDLMRRERAKDRGGFSEDQWQKRVKDDEVRFPKERISKVCDYEIDNGIDPYYCEPYHISEIKGMFTYGMKKYLGELEKTAEEQER